MPLSKRQFFASLLVLAVCLVVANAFVAFLTRHSLPRRFLSGIANTPGAPIVALGNSLLVVGFDVPEFNSLMDFSGPGRQAINLAMGSTNPVEHLLFLRYAFRSEERRVGKEGRSLGMRWDESNEEKWSGEYD